MVHILIYPNNAGFKNFKPKIKLNINIYMFKSLISNLVRKIFYVKLRTSVNAIGFVQVFYCTHHYNYIYLGLDEHFEQHVITASLMSLPVK